MEYLQKRNDGTYIMPDLLYQKTQAVNQTGFVCVINGVYYYLATFDEAIDLLLKTHPGKLPFTDLLRRKNSAVFINESYDRVNWLASHDKILKCRMSKRTRELVYLMLQKAFRCPGCSSIQINRLLRKTTIWEREFEILRWRIKHGFEKHHLA